jgi:Tfp pilus assembly protein PilN
VKQQINLYQPIFRKQKKVFSAIAMLQMTGFFMVVLAGIYYISEFKVAPFRDELDKTNTQFNRLTSQIDIISRNLPQQSGSRLLENELVRMSADLERINQVKTVLSSGAAGNADGFSSYLEALATSHVNGAWLTAINITLGGQHVNLNGNSINPELVPAYLKRLSQTPAFGNKTFNTLELERSGSEPAEVNFILGSGS